MAGGKITLAGLGKGLLAVLKAWRVVKVNLMAWRLRFKLLMKPQLLSPSLLLTSLTVTLPSLWARG